MPTRVDNNAAEIDPTAQAHSVAALRTVRKMCDALITLLDNLPYTGANKTITVRALEDARMRAGKSLEPFAALTGFVPSDKTDQEMLNTLQDMVKAESIAANEPQA